MLLAETDCLARQSKETAWGNLPEKVATNVFQSHHKVLLALRLQNGAWNFALYLVDIRPQASITIKPFKSAFEIVLNC